MRLLIPAIILIACAATGLGVNYYFANAGNNPPKVSWDVNPLKIAMSPDTGLGSLPDSFTCSSQISPVTLVVTSNLPGVVSLAVSPTTFSSCGSSPDNLVVTATCTSTSSVCQQGSIGTVQVCGPTPYTCLQRMLNVIITFNGNSQQKRS